MDGKRSHWAVPMRRRAACRETAASLRTRGCHWAHRDQPVHQQARASAYQNDLRQYRRLCGPVDPLARGIGWRGRHVQQGRGAGFPHPDQRHRRPSVAPRMGLNWPAGRQGRRGERRIACHAILRKSVMRQDKRLPQDREQPSRLRTIPDKIYPRMSAHGQHHADLERIF